MRKVGLAATGLLVLVAAGSGGWVWARNEAKTAIDRGLMDLREAGAQVASYEGFRFHPLSRRVEITNLRYEADAPEATRLVAAKVIAEGVNAGAADRIVLESVSGNSGGTDHRSGRIEIEGFRGSGADLVRRAATLGAVSLADRLAALEGVSAQSIRIPEFALTVSVGSQQSEYVFRDVAARGIERGRIASLEAAGGSAKLRSPLPKSSGDFTFGHLIAHDLDLAGIARTLAAKASSDAPFGTVCAEALLEDLRGTVSDGSTISVARVSAKDVALKPGPTPIAEHLAIIERVGADGVALAEPEQRKLAASAAELIGRFRFARFEASSLAVKPKEASGEMRLAKLALGSFEAGRLASIEAEGLEGTGPDGPVKLGALSLEGLSLTGFLDAVVRLAKDPDLEPDASLVHELVPSLDRLALRSLEVALPGDRKGSLEAFDLAYGPRVDGIPTAVTSRLTRLVVPLDPALGVSVRQLGDLGYGTLDLGFSLDVAWRAGSGEYEISDLTLAADRMGKLALTGLMTGLPKEAFSPDLSVALPALQAARLVRLALRIGNDGLFERVVDHVAQEENTTPEETRALLAEQTAMIAELASEEQLAQQISAALGRFIDEPRSLAIVAEPAEPVSLVELITALGEELAAILDLLHPQIRANE